MNEELRVIIYQEDDLWIAQCLEYDVLAQAKTFDAVREEFEIALELAISEDGKLNRDPAPEIFTAMWDARSGEFSPTSPLNVAGRSASFGMVAA